MPTLLTAHELSTTLTAPRLVTTLTAHLLEVSGTADEQWTILSEDAFNITDEVGVIVVSEFESTPAGHLTAPRIAALLTAHPVDFSKIMSILWSIQAEDAFDLLNEAGETIVTDAEDTPVGRLTSPRITALLTAHPVDVVGQLTAQRTMPTLLTAHPIDVIGQLTAQRITALLTAHPIDFGRIMSILWSIQAEDAFDIMNEAGEFIVTAAEDTPVGQLTAPRIVK